MFVCKAGGGYSKKKMGTNFMKKKKRQCFACFLFCVLNIELFYTVFHLRVWSSSEQLCFLKPNLMIMLTGVNREYHLPGSIQIQKLHYPSLSSSNISIEKEM